MNFEIHSNPNARDVMVGYLEGFPALAAILYYNEEVVVVGDEVKPLQWARDIWGWDCPF